MAKTFKYTYGYEPYETLPPVSAEDNGKVLGVSDGSYALVNGGGGASSMVVEMLISESNIPYLDCPSDELFEAFNSGTNIVVKDTSEGPTVLNQVYCAIRVTEADDDVYTFFVETFALGGLSTMRFDGIGDMTPSLNGGGDDPTPGPDPIIN